MFQGIRSGLGCSQDIHVELECLLDVPWHDFHMVDSLEYHGYS